VLQFKPVIWEKREIQELPTFAGDPDGVAFGINDNGQVVGSSGTCTTFSLNTFTNLLPLHALLWQKGAVTDLGNLGGAMNNNIAFAVNNQGKAVGVSDLPGDTTFHAFLWTRETGMQDLSTLPGDVASVGLGIDDKGKIVGVSLDASFNLRPFLRQNGVMTDLNTLIPADSPLFLLIAEVINSRGEIAGSGVQTSTGEVHGFLATPIHSEAGSESAAPAAQGESGQNSKVALPENVRKMLRQRLGSRYHIPGIVASPRD
jgi:probable HAF family extracellular repeat protein